MADPGGGQGACPLLESREPLASAYDLALLDLDGVVYIGPRAVPGAPEALAAAVAAGMRLSFVTNNASRTPAEVADHLVELGVPATAVDVVTSGQAAAHLLADRVPPGAAVLVVGSNALRNAIREEGLRPVRSLEERPVAVVQGFSPDIGWRHLAEAGYAVRSGLFWVATNPDLTVPTDRGRAPGNGSLVAAVRAAAGTEPQIAGKPEPPLFAEVVRRCGGRRPLVVGDRLDTDIEGAVRSGHHSLVVLTGVTSAELLLAVDARGRPSYLGADLSALSVPHPRPVRSQDTWAAGDAWLRLRTDGTPDCRGSGLDLLRVACAAAWDAADHDKPVDAAAVAGVVSAGLGPAVPA